MEITKEELRQMMSEVVREELSRLRHKETPKSRYSIKEAVSYLHEIGLETTINGLYTFLSRRMISADKTNGKLSFERTELDRFVKTRRKPSSKQDAACFLQKAANAKDRRAIKTS